MKRVVYTSFHGLSEIQTGIDEVNAEVSRDRSMQGYEKTTAKQKNSYRETMPGQDRLHHA